MDWFTYTWVLVPAWALTLLLDCLYFVDFNPNLVGRILGVVFGRAVPHGLLYAAPYSSSYFWSIYSYVFDPLRSYLLPLPMWRDPVIYLIYLAMLPFCYAMLPSDVAGSVVPYFWAGMIGLVLETVLVGTFVAMFTGDVAQRHRMNRLRDEIFRSDTPEAFLDRIIGGAVVDEGNPKMKELLDDLQALGSVYDSKALVINNALERHERHSHALAETTRKRRQS
jgi:hypothetical protein